MTLVLVKAKDGHTVDAEHERGQGRLRGRQIGGSFYDSTLKGRRMRDLEQRVDIVEVDLPQPEDVDWTGMQSRKIDCPIA